MKDRVVMLVQAAHPAPELVWKLACIEGVYRVDPVRGTYSFVVCATESAVTEVERLPEVDEVEVCRVAGDGGWEVPW